MASKKIKKLQDELASYVRHRFEEAKSAKAEEYERLNNVFVKYVVMTSARHVMTLVLK